MVKIFGGFGDEVICCVFWEVSVTGGVRKYTILSFPFPPRAGRILYKLLFRSHFRLPTLVMSLPGPKMLFGE